jgi:hypothetical protein
LLRKISNPKAIPCATPASMSLLPTDCLSAMKKISLRRYYLCIDRSNLNVSMLPVTNSLIWLSSLMANNVLVLWLQSRFIGGCLHT